jgi:hypothetical protein
LLLVGCSGDKVTEIVVAISTDVPMQSMDRVRFEARVRDENGELFSDLSWDLARSDGTEQPGAITLPATLGLVPGPTVGTQPLLLTVSGYKTDNSGGVSFVLDRKAKLAFVSERRLLLRLALLGRCIGVTCGQDETCGDSGCEKIEKDGRDLPTYTDKRANENPELGAGPLEAGIDAGVDTMSDLPRTWEEQPPEASPGDGGPGEGLVDGLAGDLPRPREGGSDLPLTPDGGSPDSLPADLGGFLDMATDLPTDPDMGGSPDTMPHDMFTDPDMGGSPDTMPHDMFTDPDMGSSPDTMPHDMFTDPDMDPDSFWPTGDSTAFPPDGP